MSILRFLADTVKLDSNGEKFEESRTEDKKGKEFVKTWKCRMFGISEAGSRETLDAS